MTNMILMPMSKKSSLFDDNARKSLWCCKQQLKNLLQTSSVWHVDRVLLLFLMDFLPEILAFNKSNVVRILLPNISSAVKVPVVDYGVTW